MTSGIERRRAPRHPTMGVVARCVHPGDGEFVVADLSTHGALIVGKTALPMGQSVMLELQVPGEVPVFVKAQVTRCLAHEDGYRAGVQFLEATSEAERFVRDAIETELLRRRHPVVLVVAEAVGAAIDLWSDLDEVGCDARVVVSPEEAFDALYARDLPVCTVLADVRGGLSVAVLDLVSHIRERFPAVRTVFLHGDGPHPELAGVQWFPVNRWTAAERAVLLAPERCADLDAVPPV